MISLKIDWLDLLAAQETFRSLFQHHSSKASVLQSWAVMTLPASQSLRVKVHGLPATFRDGPLTPEPSKMGHYAAGQIAPSSWGSPFQWLGSAHRVFTGQGPTAVT